MLTKLLLLLLLLQSDEGAATHRPLLSYMRVLWSLRWPGQRRSVFHRTDARRLP
jgi:hypothetical protein